MKNRVIMTMIICGVCLVLFAVMFMQFRTIEETDITEIENMREAELRTAISEWKSKYEETAKQLEANQKSIDEYQQKIEQNGEASELVDKDLEETVASKISEYEENMENLHFSNAIDSIWGIISRTNKYIDKHK